MEAQPRAAVHSHMLDWGKYCPERAARHTYLLLGSGMKRLVVLGSIGQRRSLQMAACCHTAAGRLVGCCRRHCIQEHRFQGIWEEQFHKNHD